MEFSKPRQIKFNHTDLRYTTTTKLIKLGIRELNVCVLSEAKLNEKLQDMPKFCTLKLVEHLHRLKNSFRTLVLIHQALRAFISFLP